MDWRGGGDATRDAMRGGAGEGNRKGGAPRRPATPHEARGEVMQDEPEGLLCGRRSAWTHFRVGAAGGDAARAVRHGWRERERREVRPADGAAEASRPS